MKKFIDKWNRRFAVLLLLLLVENSNASGQEQKTTPLRVELSDIGKRGPKINVGKEVIMDKGHQEKEATQGSTWNSVNVMPDDQKKDNSSPKRKIIPPLNQALASMPKRQLAMPGWAKTGRQSTFDCAEQLMVWTLAVQ